MIQTTDTNNTIAAAADRLRRPRERSRRTGDVDPRSAAFQFVNAHQASLQVNVASRNAMKLRTPGSAKTDAAAEARSTVEANEENKDRPERRARPEVRDQAARAQTAASALTPERAAGNVPGRSRSGAGAKAAPRDTAAPVSPTGLQGGATPAPRSAATAGVAAAAGVVTPRSGPASAGGQAAGAIGGVQGGSSRADALAKLVEKSVPARRAVVQREVEQNAIKAMNLALKEGGGDATLRLAPDALGALKVELSVRDAHVRATFRATTDLARDLLVESMSILRDALEAQGLTVDEVVVEGPRTDARPAVSPAPAHDAQSHGHERSRTTAEPARASETAGGGAGETGGGARDQGDRHGAEDRGARAEGGGGPLEAGAPDGVGALGGRISDGFDWLA
ncbi:MAG TPA: flagellar hook-length control protein FliK [Phycisphaerales bacterium]|nr:flagellar hook-length control protein FliK [Phycisphaerales bacterium]